MANIANALRDEIVRISRREGRKQNAALQRASAQYRRDIAVLKREVARLNRDLKQQQRNTKKAGAPAADAKAGTFRFVAKGFKTLRQRLGLSAAQMGKLLGVSEQSVYNWESKMAAPRATHFPTIAHLRGLGKREVAALLEQKS